MLWMLSSSVVCFVFDFVVDACLYVGWCCWCQGCVWGLMCLLLRLLWMLGSVGVCLQYDV